MIDKSQIWPLILRSTPSFQNEFDQKSSADVGLDYMIAANYGRHLLRLYQTGETKIFPALSQTIEQLIVEGDVYVSEFAVIGILEGIVLTWRDENIDTKYLAQHLLPTSLAYWESIAKFWNGEIAYVGADIKS